MEHRIKVLLIAVGISASLVCAQGDGLQDDLPIATTPNTLLPCEPESQGWRLLHKTGNRDEFDKNFTQWISGNTTNTALPSNWTYQASDMSIYSQGGTADLRSEWQLGDKVGTDENSVGNGDFDYRMTYRNSGNDAIFYKMLTRGSFAWSVGIEYAIENNVNAGKQSAGSVFDIWAPTPPASQIYNAYSGGKWNQARIVVKGDSVEHWLNNRRVGRYKMWDATFLAARANSKWSGDNSMGQNTPGCQCKVPKGYIGFQGDHDGTWHMRDVRILTKSENVKTGKAGPCTGTDVMQPAARQLQYSLERLPGAMRFHLREGAIAKAEVQALNGRLAARAAIEGNGSAVVIREWKQPGVYFLRVSMRDGKAQHRVKLVLP